MWHPSLGRFLLTISLCWLRQASGCIGSQPRQFSNNEPTYIYPNGQGGGQAGGGNYFAPSGSGGAQAGGAPNLQPLRPIGIDGGPTSPQIDRSGQVLLGDRVGLAEFSSSGYNAEGGGPVAHGVALHCDFEGRPCCWANVPTPDDQIDWHLASGHPNSKLLGNTSINGRYLAAFASEAAPSDEAQLASCSIACSSSPIRIRARHWQSTNVLLQVCQRESFPNSINFNPLINCQEFPMSSDIGFTELVLPKASLVDIIFVASNFVNEAGDIALLDDVHIEYQSDPAECGGALQPTSTVYPISSKASPSTQKSVVAGGGGPSPTHVPSPTNAPNPSGQKSVDAAKSSSASSPSSPVPLVPVKGQASTAGVDGSTSGGGSTDIKVITDEAKPKEDTEIRKSVGAGAGIGAGVGAPAALGASGSSGGKLGSSGSSQSGGGLIQDKSDAKDLDQSGISSDGAQAHGSDSTKFSSKTSQSSIRVHSKTPEELPTKPVTAEKSCQAIKCSFEDGTTCGYRETQKLELETVRGLTTRFQVVKGQFMNRVTGVKEGIGEGNYYVAVFLYPREKAGLMAQVGGHLMEAQRLRFQYYEGTHGVQLKGCCDSMESCPFSSDKFVTVTDRMWKWGSFACPSGTRRILFLCENTRTNQGACAIDDIQVVENRRQVTLQDKPLC